MRYSFIGKKVVRVCYWCFRNTSKNVHQSLREREIGKRAYVQSKSISAIEMCNWFNGLMRYIQKSTRGSNSYLCDTY